MNFEDILKLLKAGHMVRRSKWLEKDFIKMTVNNEIVYQSNNGHVNWKISNEDIIAEDWKCLDWGTFYDQGHLDGYKLGWDEALEKYLDLLDTFPNPGREPLKNIIHSLKMEKEE